MVTGVSPAFASRPVSWPPADPVSPLDFIIVLVLIPAGLFILIALLSAIPSMARGDSTYQPGLAWRNEPEWFGGPRGGLDKADEPAELEAGESSDRGGASARW
jgi:hypothetical protein